MIHTIFSRFISVPSSKNYLLSYDMKYIICKTRLYRTIYTTTGVGQPSRLPWRRVWACAVICGVGMLKEKKERKPRVGWAYPVVQGKLPTL